MVLKRFRACVRDIIVEISPCLVEVFYGGFWAMRDKICHSSKNHGLAHYLYFAYLEHIGSFIGLQTKFMDIPIFPHGLKSIFISNDAVIGARCVIFQQVTIGSNNLGVVRSAPIVEDDCYIGSGAKIIGRCRLGHHSRVGANCVVWKDVPPNTTVVINDIRYIRHEMLNDNTKW